MLPPWRLALFWGLLIISSAQTSPRGPALLNIGTEIIKKAFFQELTNQNAITTLKNLSLYEAMRKHQNVGFPYFGNLISELKQNLLWLKVTEARIPQMVFQRSNMDVFQFRISLDLVVGLNNAIARKIIELGVQIDVTADIHTVTDDSGNSRLVFDHCTYVPGNIHINLLTRFSVTANLMVKEVTVTLMPSLPTLLKKEVCPVLQQAFESMISKMYTWPTLPMPISSSSLNFEVLSSSIVGHNFQLDLNAKLKDSTGKVIDVFNESTTSLVVPRLNDLGLSFLMREDVVNAIYRILMPAREQMTFLELLFPKIARKMKAVIQTINPEAAAKLDKTQIVKFAIRKPAKIIMEFDRITAAEEIVLELFPSNQLIHPLFTLGIEANYEGYFYTNGNNLIFSLIGLSSSKLHLMNSGMGHFNHELLKDMIKELLYAVLIPYQNDSLRKGIPMPIFAVSGVNKTNVTVIQGELLVNSV